MGSRRNTELFLLVAAAFPVDAAVRALRHHQRRGAQLRDTCGALRPVCGLHRRAHRHALLRTRRRPRHLAGGIRALGHRHHLRHALGARARHEPADHPVRRHRAHGGHARAGEEPRHGQALQVHLRHHRYLAARFAHVRGHRGVRLQAVGADSRPGPLPAR